MKTDKNKLDLGTLRIFLEVYRTGSITAASDSLDMTQPGVSSAIKRLQSLLGVALFVRSGRTIVPTQKGVAFAEQLQKSLLLLDEAVDSLSDFNAKHKRTFKLLVNEAIINVLQPLIDSDTQLENIKIELHPLPVNEETVEEQLSLSQYDLAIDIYQPQNPSFVSELLYHDNLVVVCRQNHPRIGNAIDGEQFLAEKHIIIMLRRGNVPLAEKFTHDLPQRQISSISNSLLGALYLSSISDNICTTSHLLSHEVAKNLPIRVLKFPFQTTGVDHTMIWHRRNQNIGASVWLRSKIKSYLQIAIDASSESSSAPNNPES